MRLVPILALALFLAGCDVIYERQPQFDLDYGIPYAIETGGAVMRMPLLDDAGFLNLTVSYYERCDDHLFEVLHRRPTEDFAQIWVRHIAPLEACQQARRVVRPLRLALPAGAQDAPELVLIGPDDRQYVLRED